MSQKTLHLRVLSGGEVIDSYSFDQPVVRIGRTAKAKGQANDVVLKNNKMVSGLHAQIFFDKGRVSIVDCSQNGTFVSGKMLDNGVQKQLVTGEEITIQDFTIRWWVQSDASSSAGSLGRTPRPMPTDGSREANEENEENKENKENKEMVALVPEESGLPDFDFPAPEESGTPGIGGGGLSPVDGGAGGVKPTGPLPIIPQTEESSPGSARFDPDLESGTADDERPQLGPHNGPGRAFTPTGTGPLPLVPLVPLVPQIDEPLAGGAVGSAPGAEAIEVAEVGQSVRGPSTELAAVYRSLAEEFGASVWGRIPNADASDLSALRDAAQRLLERTKVQNSELWINWLADEICGLDPIRALLGDSKVVRIIVHGEDPIRVLREATWEIAARRFSCVEAVVAAVWRWTQQRLVDRPIECVRGRLTIRAFGGSLAPLGPVITLRRSSSKAVSGLDDLVNSRVLSAGAAELLRAALARSASILIYGSALASPSTLLKALWRSLADEALALIVRRGSDWSPRQALVVDGRVAAAAEVWHCVQSVAPQWLFVEEVGLADAVPLCTYARHRGGGTVATLWAASGDAALGRLKAALAASLGSSASACQAVVAESFDLVVGISGQANG
ncbi:MAG TPA: FHA domain-containing protein, partial [Nannocystis exedens]|nr:FHA domain-containing protein [Nannocystis exedens]